MLTYYHHLYLSKSPNYRTEDEIRAQMLPGHNEYLRAQEKYDSAYSLNGCNLANWYSHCKYTLGFILELKNIVNNHDSKCGRYEQTRLWINTESTVPTY